MKYTELSKDTQGLDAYIKYMVDNEDKPLGPGPAFGFVQGNIQYI